MEYPIPTVALKMLRWPGIHAAAGLLLKWGLKRGKEKLPGELLDSAESFFVHDLIGNIDNDRDGKIDSFRLAVTNAWFDQAVTGLELSIDGKAIPPSRILVDNDFARVRADQIRRLRFVAGRPFAIVIEGKKLRKGLHIISLELRCELANMTFPLIPIRMTGEEGHFALFDDPWERSLMPLFTEHRPAIVHFCPHIHYDFEWLQTAERFLRVAVGNLEEAVRILETTPGSTFVVDQVPQLEALADESPEVFKKLQGFVRDGRVEATLGGYIEPDTNLPSGESLVRQFVRWQEYSKRVFGRISRTGWLIDSFGMSAQLPQIIRKCGGEALVFSRRLPPEADAESDFWWEGIDGTRIQTHHLSHYYFAGYPLDSDPQRAAYRLFRTYRKLAEGSSQRDLFCPSGIDHGKPQAIAAEVLHHWNQTHGDVEFIFSTPSHYLKSLNQEEFAVVEGELNGELTGVNAARIDLKQKSREAESICLSAESLTGINRVIGRTEETDLLDEAWKAILESHFHDSITGCNTDEVADEIQLRLARASDQGRHIRNRMLANLAGQTTRGSAGHRAVFVFNPTGFSRKEVVETDLHAINGQLPYLTDGERFVPYQVLAMDRFHDDSDKRAKVCFIAQVPAFGYRVFYLTDQMDFQKPAKFSPVRVDSDRMENELLQVRFNPTNGAILYAVEPGTTRLWQLRETGMLSLRTDRGTLYQEFQFGGLTRPRDVHWRVLERGPIRGVLEARGKLGKSEFCTLYTLFSGSRQVRVRTIIDFNDPGKALFAHVSKDPYPFDLVSEIPFGSIQRKPGSWIAQNYIHLHYQNDRSLSVFNRGIPGFVHLGKQVRLALHRSVDKIHFWNSGRKALGLQRHTFEYAFRFTDGGIDQAMPWRHGENFNHPLLALEMIPETASEERRPVPQRKSFASVSKNNVVISSFAPVGDHEIQLRCFEAQGESTEAELELGFRISNASITDMLGRTAGPLEFQPERIPLQFRPFEIKTIRLTLETGRDR